MKIGILGAGEIGLAIARQLARNGIDASIANSRGPESLKALTDELGPHIKAVTAKEAGQADLVFVAVNWDRLADAMKALGPWNGRILVDTNNAYKRETGEAYDLGGRSSSEWVAEWAPGARLVKAFNHLYAASLDADPRVGDGRRVLFLAGDDADARKTVSDLIASLGYAPIDLGVMTEDRLVPYRDPLVIVNLVQLDD